MKNNSVRVLALSAGLASISAIVQLIHIGYLFPQWGMWIDIVAVSWIIAFFLFGLRSAFTVSLIGALVITLFAPDTWLGAFMKWTATMPLWLSLFLWLFIGKKKNNYYEKFSHVIIPVIIGVVIRSLIIIPVNYYYAIPIWTGMTVNQSIAAIPWYIIAGFNTLQAVLDVVLAWIVVFRFKIVRFAPWYEEKL